MFKYQLIFPNNDNNDGVGDPLRSVQEINYLIPA